MNLKSIEKWVAILDKNRSNVIFENYIYGFEKITKEDRAFETIRVFVTLNINAGNEIVCIEAFPWSNGETYTTMEYLVSAELRREITRLVQKELIPQARTLVFNQIALVR